MAYNIFQVMHFNITLAVTLIGWLLFKKFLDSAATSHS